MVETLLLALGGAIILEVARFPAGALVGALIGSLVASALGLPVLRLAGWEIGAIAAVIGIVLAARLSRGLVREVQRSLVPAAFTAIAMVTIGFGLGLVADALTGWGLATAAFSVYPGGLEQMVVFAGSLDGNVVIVTSVQLIRWLTVVLVYPLALGWVVRAGRTVGRGPAARLAIPTALATGAISSWSRIDTLVVVVGGIAGYAVHAQGVPGGAMLGAFLAAAVAQGAIGQRPVPIPGIVAKLTLAALGVVLGSGVDASVLFNDVTLLLWAGALTVTLIAASLVAAGILHRLTKRPLLACIVSMAPAGMVEMTILAEQLGINPVPVFVIHFARTFGIILCAPFLFAVVV